AEALKPIAEHGDGFSERLQCVGGHPHAVLPSAPVRPVSETRLEVPRMAFEPRRTLPATNVRVHAGRRRPEHFEALNVGSRWLGAAFPLGEYDVARAREAVDGDDLN